MRRGIVGFIVLILGIAALAIVYVISLTKTISSDSESGQTRVQESQKTLDNVQNKLNNDQKEQQKLIQP